MRSKQLQAEIPGSSASQESRYSGAQLGATARIEVENRADLKGHNGIGRMKSPIQKNLRTTGIGTTGRTNGDTVGVRRQSVRTLLFSVAILLFFCVRSAHAQIVFNTAYTDSVATGPSFQMNSNTAPGDAIAVWGYANPSVSDFTGVPTDTDVNKFTQSVAATTKDSIVHGVIWTETGLTGNSKDTITCHSVSTQGGTLQCYAVEMHGVNTLDQYACASGTGATPTSPTVTTTHPNEILLGFGDSSSLHFTAPGAGWANVAISSQGIEMRQVSATGNYSATFTTGGSADWVSCIAAYYNSSPGPIAQRDSGWWAQTNGYACGSAGGSVASVTCPTAPTHHGNTLVAWAAYANGSTATLTDSAGQSWTERQSIDFVGSGGNLTIWTLDNTDAGVTNIKISLSSKGPIDSGFIELTGMANPAYDSGCTGQVSGSVTTTVNCSYKSTGNDWLFALGGAATSGSSAGSGYALLNDVSTTAYFLNDPDEFRQNVAPGTQDPSFTWSGGGVWGGIAAIALKQTCGGNSHGDLKVAHGETCVLDGSTLSGDVRQTGGTLIVTGSTIKGDVRVTGDSTFSINASTVNGDLRIRDIPSGGETSLVCNTVVGGDLSVNHNETSVLVGSSGTPTCGGNKVGGDVFIQENSAAEQIVGNTVGGDLHVHENSGTTDVFNNKVTGKLYCKDNSHLLIASPNTASDYEGQCF